MSRSAALAALLLVAVMARAQTAPPKRGSFGDPSVWDWAPSRTYHVENYLLKLHFDEPKGEVLGDEVVTLRPFQPGFQEFYLDSAELSIDSVSLLPAKGSAVPLSFRPSDPKLWITLDRAYGPSDSLNIHIVYHGFPRTGLFFVNPSPAYPNWPHEVWSQGESEFNHYWFPCWDYPNDKATSETLTTVPEDQSVVSNGRLAGVTRAQGEATYDWIEAVPHSSYLISIAVGPWRKVSQQYQGKPVDTYVPRSVDAATALRSFGLTPDAIGFYAQAFGVDYPYEKYAQTTVRNFTAGGMENVSATTQTDLALHDQRADPDYPSTGLMAHELAHQWFGDLVTTRDWANIWLNEGFATFIEALYTQHHAGDDAYRYEIYQDQREAQSEDEHRYRRPIVDRHYQFPEQMFDSTTYPKGGAVLDMLRYVLDGATASSKPASQSEPLFQALRHYLLAHRAQNVDTADLTAAIRQTTGQDLDWFFHEWVFMGGYPQYQVRAAYDPAQRMESITVRQTQTAGASTPIFDMPVELTFHGASGQAKTITVRDREAEQEFDIPVEFQPEWVDFDPGDHIYKTLEFQQPAAGLMAAARQDPVMMSRLWAVQQLGHPGQDAGVVAALTQVLNQDGFYGVRAAAAQALGDIGGNQAKAALLAALSQPDSRVRTAVVGALRHYAGEADVYAALVQVLHTDTSYAAEAAAARDLGHATDPGAVEVLLAEAATDPEVHVLSGVLAGLAATHDARAAGLLLKEAQPGVPERVRITALGLLPELKEPIQRDHGPELDAVVRAALDDPFGFTREQGERVAGEFKLTSFQAFVAAQAQGAAEPQQRADAKEFLDLFTAAAGQANHGAPQAAQPGEARAAALQQLRQQLRDLEQKVKALEQKMGPAQN